MIRVLPCRKMRLAWIRCFTRGEGLPVYSGESLQVAVGVLGFLNNVLGFSKTLSESKSSKGWGDAHVLLKAHDDPSFIRFESENPHRWHSAFHCSSGLRAIMRWFSST
jgi:hypothetical protein